MAKIHNGTAVPRHFVFVTASGAVVAQLSGNRGQDLYSGQIVELSGSTQGSPATDTELDRLKIAGRVDHYDPTYVWVTGLPEPHVYDPHLSSGEGVNRIRTYYINTLLPATNLENVHKFLEQAQLGHVCSAELRSNLVAITGADGALFGDMKHAEDVLEHLQKIAHNIFAKSVIAFANVEMRDSQLVHELRPNNATSELEAIIAAQSDTSVTQDKSLLLLVSSLEERKLIYNLCLELKISVQIAATAAEAMTHLEDEAIDLLIMDLLLPDMHGWEMLGKLREVEKLRHLPIILIADHAMPEDASLTIAVANVDVYLERPLSKARLRQNIWMALSGRP